MPDSAVARSSSHEDGFGMVEVVVSMFILALIAMALLPLLIQGIKTSARTATTATATQLVNDQLAELTDYAQSQTTLSCAALRTHFPAASTNTTDSRGVALVVSRTPAACPTGIYPSTVKFTATVKRTDTTPNTTVAQADILILVNTVG